MALVYDLMGETENAEKELLRTIELAPGNASLRNQLAAFYHEKGRQQEAVAQWEESLRLNPGDKKIQMRLEKVREITTYP